MMQRNHGSNMHVIGAELEALEMSKCLCDLCLSFPSDVVWVDFYRLTMLSSKSVST